MRSYAKLIVAIIVLSACGTGSGSGDVAPASRQLTLQVSGHGSLTLSSGQGCRDRCVLAIASGTHVSVLATADTDSTFAGWSGACSGTGGCDIVVDRDLESTARSGCVRAHPGSTCSRLRRTGPERCAPRLTGSTADPPARRNSPTAPT